MMAPEARAAAGAGATPLRLKLRAAASSLAWWGWSLILVGIPLGNTTVGLAVLLAAALARLAGGGRAPCSPFARDAFYRWGWVFLAITVLSAVTSPRPHLGLATSLAFFLMFSLIACGSRMLLCGFLGILAHEMVDNVAYGMNVGGLFWLLAGLMAHLGRPGGTSRTC